MPFNTEQFLDVFRRYNEAVWPAQWILHALALTAVVLAVGRRTDADRRIAGILAVLWLWMGAVYHLAFFRDINPAALGFGLLFLVQAAAFAWIGVRRRQLTFRVRADAVGLVGTALVLYALVLYPALGYALGRRYPAIPSFGLPCPTTIFTFGLLLWATPGVPRRLLLVPALWSLLGAVAAVRLGMVEDLGLLLAGAVTTGAVLRRAPARQFASEGA